MSPDQHAQRAILLCWLGTTLINSGIDWDRGYEVIRSGHVTAFECGDPRAIGWAIPIYGFGYHFPQGIFVEALRLSMRVSISSPNWTGCWFSIN